ncbi:choice-of-anchor I family protein [Nostocaceae cyanobacterium CENA357]|uniref:Choice-of-anchor I family protein n=1 Tax=Atlanticothrix silvestris CENA357 TaxID=1725252 RepID=A0A8J7KYN8_9CYAN|nr:choice-of-anchor I family protein [Atlanticothrix silvestris]MBH8551484.1 choice-of-anchor I family protein [Atlanticothrix silvestris CENA357]
MTIQKLIAFIAPSAILLGVMTVPAEAVSLKPLGTYNTGLFDEGGAEIPTYDPLTQRLFVVNGGAKTIDVISISDPTKPSLLSNIDITPFGGGANSVVFKNGLLAAAVEAVVPQDPGKVVFFNTNGDFLNSVTVGSLPDMLTFTPDGTRVLVANEGEPNSDYTIDPEGSVSIINLDDYSVINAGFSQFNSQIDQLRSAGIRVFGPNATVAQDVEPEYITVSEDSTKAWVSLQESNAIAVLDLIKNEITNINPLGFKDYNQPGNGIDASDRDDTINIANWPVLGMYQPDAIASYTVNGKTYIVTANEGDTRDYDAFSEEVRLGNNAYQLDPNAFPNAEELKLPENLGRLTVTNTLGDIDGDGLFEQIYAFGGRSFSILEWDEATKTLKQVYDSGDDFEQIIAQRLPNFFNSNNDENSFDTRSDDKGPEPEDVKIAEINNRFYAFVGLERVGGVMTYDVTDPFNPVFIDYVNNRDFTSETTVSGETNPAIKDLGPEGLLFISAANSPNGKPLLVAANEVSGTTTIFSIEAKSVPEPGAIFGLLTIGAMGIMKFKRKH